MGGTILGHSLIINKRTRGGFFCKIYYFTPLPPHVTAFTVFPSFKQKVIRNKLASFMNFQSCFEAEKCEFTDIPENWWSKRKNKGKEETNKKKKKKKNKRKEIIKYHVFQI